MFSKVFVIDFNRLVMLLLPTFLRKVKMVAWLQMLVTPIKMVYSDFMNNRAENLNNLQHNGQVCYLRCLLNDKFDPVLRRIRITNGSAFEAVYAFTYLEAQPKYLGSLYLRQYIDYADNGIDFMVIIPADLKLQNSIEQLKATMDYYKLASKRGRIQFEEVGTPL